MKVLDLFSGFGGWSQAFYSAGHEVMRIENNPLLENVANTHLICVKEFRDAIIARQERGYILQSPDVIMASPPCYEFSLAYGAPRGKAQRAGEEFEPSMELLEVTLDIINLLKPKYWVIENVVGAIKYFEDYLGEPKQKLGAYVLWGNFPTISLAEKLPTKKSKDKRHSPLRSNYRAEIPLPLSMGLLRAIVEQKSLFDYC